MINSIHIRIAITADLPNMQTILQTASRDWNKAMLSSCFADHYQSWIVCVENKIAGFLTIKDNVDFWEIMQLVVDVQYQRQGLATQLLEYVIDQAKKTSVKKIQLEVRRSNLSAIHLYEKMHFQQVGVRKKYYADKEDAVLMDLNFT